MTLSGQDQSSIDYFTLLKDLTIEDKVYEYTICGQIAAQKYLDGEEIGSVVTPETTPVLWYVDASDYNMWATKGQTVQLQIRISSHVYPEFLTEMFTLPLLINQCDFDIHMFEPPISRNLDFINGELFYFVDNDGEVKIPFGSFS